MALTLFCTRIPVSVQVKEYWRFPNPSFELCSIDVEKLWMRFSIVWISAADITDSFTPSLQTATIKRKVGEKDQKGQRVNLTTHQLNAICWTKSNADPLIYLCKEAFHHCWQSRWAFLRHWNQTESKGRREPPRPLSMQRLETWTQKSLVSLWPSYNSSYSLWGVDDGGGEGRGVRRGGEVTE